MVLWQAITGKCPFASATAEGSLVKINHGPKPPISKSDPALAGSAEDAIVQALSPDLQEIGRAHV